MEREKEREAEGSIASIIPISCDVTTWMTRLYCPHHLLHCAHNLMHGVHIPEGGLNLLMIEDLTRFPETAVAAESSSS